MWFLSNARIQLGGSVPLVGGFGELRGWRRPAAQVSASSRLLQQGRPPHGAIKKYFETVKEEAYEHRLDALLTVTM
jgi:hypothetical protein